MEKSKKRSKLRLINFKATADEYATMKRIARVYTGGNVSGLVRLLTTDRRLLKSSRIRVRKAA